MDALSRQEISSVMSSVAAVRGAWLEAVKAGDAERLVALATDGVVVVHGSGRCVRGREELRQDFLKGFDTYFIEQDVSNSEVVIRGQWAFEISDVESTLTPNRGGEVTRVRSTTVVALSHQLDGSWKVGRVIGVLPSAPHAAP